MKKFWEKIKKAIKYTDTAKDKIEKIGVPVPIIVSKSIDVAAELTKNKEENQCPK